MKKYSPFIFPTIALLVVLFLGYRWYRSQTAGVKPTEITENEKIEQLSAQDVNRLQKTPAKDLKTIQLTSKNPQVEAMGEVRYEIQDGRVLMTVAANLPVLEAKSRYEVWVGNNVNADGGGNWQKATTMEETKSGYMSSVSVPESYLPFAVSVRKVLSTGAMEGEVLQGTVPR